MSGTVPSAFGPTLSSRLPPLATVSTSMATIWAALRKSPTLSLRFTQNDDPSPRHTSQARSGGTAGTSYSNVTKSGSDAKKRSLHTTSKPCADAYSLASFTI